MGSMHIIGSVNYTIRVTDSRGGIVYELRFENVCIKCNEHMLSVSDKKGQTLYLVSTCSNTVEIVEDSILSRWEES